MLKRHLHAAFRVLVLACCLLASPFAFAQCGCPSDGHGAKLVAGTGLGQAFPAVDPASRNSAWPVYEFQREGVRYVQINDRDGNVRAAIGLIGGMAWVLPMGIDADRVHVATGNALSAAGARRVFGNAELVIEYVLDRDRRPAWEVRVLAQSK